ncbi:hypothetical protein EFV37_25100 [Mesorhizobium loti]|uniref:Uncharacterized protein n=1 Tax=Mesorhizobium jarvisii TaxID=1777867 RepID=A0A6M7TJW8_9HYPH|nr:MULTISPECIES: hypothetical protein [Mesorhizobium]OBQ68400.1 hypothetical protein A9K72_09115 [Mesorhizobium loti]QKC65179.1 hypothetical protein EB229_25095 [Mesorhizobium jarvisii]QKD11094.1 hypothetical protein EFV37_25100 [Mesorhizobium loti]RJT31100.1 hypothetical protein D3242_22840 [Mesorhizobium jarvisii]
MKLKSIDQISISAVKADSLRPGEEFEVGDAYGAELIKQHPDKFEVLEAAEEKSEAAPENKAEGAAPANKVITGRKTKAKAK